VFRARIPLNCSLSNDARLNTCAVVMRQQPISSRFDRVGDDDDAPASRPEARSYQNIHLDVCIPSSLYTRSTLHTVVPER
jgi:hypothetical protein